MNTVTNKQILKLIEAGIQAPSADNGQPWKFKILKDGVELSLDPMNMGLFFDVNQVGSQISAGAVIENIVISAKAYGLKTNIIYSNEPANNIAKLTFTTTTNQVDTDETIEAIFNRHCNRNLYIFNKKIPASIINELVSLVQSDGQHQLHTYQTPKDKNSIIRTITATDTVRFIHKRVHNDFYKVLRFGKTAKKTRDGLAAATLGLEFFMIPILQLLRPWLVTRLLNYVGLHRIMAFRGTWLPLKSSSHIVSIVHNGPANYIESGRILQRFWIEANKAGLSVQPAGALALFLARLHLVRGDGFTQTQLKTLTSLENDFASITPKFNKETDQLIMMFRLGYTKKPAVTSYRREIESFLIADYIES
jgi:hypothetical protein